MKTLPSNPALNRTLRDKAAQRRLAPRWASLILLQTLSARASLVPGVLHLLAQCLAAWALRSLQPGLVADLVRLTEFRVSVRRLAQVKAVIR